MGRGKAWDIDENEVLARAWISASEDPIAGVDQRGKLFNETVYRRFSERAPACFAGIEGKYGLRTPGSIRNHAGDLSADAQKFSKTLRTVRACGPTGVTENQVLSMAVAVHVGKCATMNYEQKDFSHSNWPGFKAWNLWKNHPKWTSPAATDSTSGGTETTSAQGGGTTQAPFIEQQQCSSQTLEPNTNEADNVRNRSPARNAEERFGLGTKTAKLVRQEELRTQAVRSMAESAKRKSDALEERNAIAAFSRPEAEGLPETSQFFAALRSNYLAQVLKKARLAGSELTDSSPIDARHDSAAETPTEGGGAEAGESQSEPAPTASE